MQLFIPAPAQDLRPFSGPSWVLPFHRLMFTRTVVGFTIGEALVWFGFVVMWPMILGGIYLFGGLFEAGKVMPPGTYIVTSLVVVFIKVLVILPFWWLFFLRLKTWPVWKRALLHLPAGCVYAVLSVFLVYQIKVHFLQSLPPSNAIVVGSASRGTPPNVDPYPWSVVLLDSYNMLTAYFMNFLVFHAYNFWLSTQRQRRKEQEIRELAFQSEINALKTQIEPHFLFNTLNSISATVPPSLEQTRVLIAQLADTFRYALRVNESRFVPLGDELDFLKTWLALEQHRFGKRLQLQYNIDPSVLCTSVPPMLLQPLVENALNHGIAHRIEGGTVTIECRKKDDVVFFAVCDTGVGYAGDLEQLMNKGVGLSNIAKRLQLLYNQTLQVERQQQGLCFSFLLPLKPVHETERIYH
jgi:two-component system, LytTR family, sensor kinase